MSGVVAPRAESIFTLGPNRRVVGIVLFCPECPNLTVEAPLRVETGDDYPPGQAPELVAQAGPLGFIARCDRCGFRVEMHGDRLPPVAMLGPWTEAERRQALRRATGPHSSPLCYGQVSGCSCREAGPGDGPGTP